MVLFLLLSLVPTLRVSRAWVQDPGLEVDIEDSASNSETIDQGLFAAGTDFRPVAHCVEQGLEFVVWE